METDLKNVKVNINSHVTPEEFARLGRQLKTLTTAVVVLAVLIVGLAVAVGIALGVQGGKASDDDTKELTTGLAHVRMQQVIGTGAWATKSNMPQALSDLTAVTIPHDQHSGYERIMLIGGMDGDGKASDKVYEYDPLLHRFDVLPPLPEPRFRHAAALRDGKVWVIGGLDAADAAVASDKTFVFDLKAKAWSDGPATAVRHVDACAGVAGNELLVFGGYDTEKDYAPLKEVEKFVPSITEGHAGPKAGKWERAADLPTARGDIQCVAVGKNITVLGGWLEDWSAPRSTVEVYMSDQKAWTKAPDMMYPRGDKAAAALPDGRVLVIAGEYASRGQTQIPRHNVEAWFPEYGKWIPMAPVPTARFRFAAAMADGAVFVFGGHQVCETNYDTYESTCPGTALNSVEAFLDSPHVAKL